MSEFITGAAAGGVGAGALFLAAMLWSRTRGGKPPAKPVKK